MLYGLCYLPLGNCPGETALVPPHTMVARTGQLRATNLRLALLAASSLLALLAAGLLAAGCCLLAVLLGTCPLRDWAYQKIYPTLCYKPSIFFQKLSRFDSVQSP